ncbi:FRAS1 [Symbiodinium sp. KB8]|nr:FRAS1 [Symbiodinium sp. KB8]
MLHVLSVSGEVQLTIELASFLETVPAGSCPVQALKQHWHGLCGQPRFRQRLSFLDDGLLLNDNDKQVLRPGEVQLVHLNFSPTSEEQIKELQHAAENGWTSCVEFILQRPQDPDLNLGCPPLYAASSEGHLEVVRLLLEASADKDKATNDGRTPLFVAAGQSHLEVARFLLEAKADKDKATHDGFTPLCFAVQEGHLEIVGLLLDAKADMNTVRDSGSTPLTIVAERGHLEVARLLLEAKADTNKAVQDGVTALIFAAHEGQLGVARLLLEAKADKNKAMTDGSTPLLCASQEGQLEMVRLLLEANADKDEASNDGITPLIVAAEEGHLDVVRLLLKGKADKDKAMNDGTTPLSVSVRHGHWQVAHLLQRMGYTFGRHADLQLDRASKGKTTNDASSCSSISKGWRMGHTFGRHADLVAAGKGKGKATKNHGSSSSSIGKGKAANDGSSFTSVSRVVAAWGTPSFGRPAGLVGADKGKAANDGSSSSSVSKGYQLEDGRVLAGRKDKAMTLLGSPGGPDGFYRYGEEETGGGYVLCQDEGNYECPAGYYEHGTEEVGGPVGWYENIPDDTVDTGRINMFELTNRYQLFAKGTECKDSAFLTPFGRDICPDGYWELPVWGGVGNSCPLCAENCSLCTSPTVCQECRNSTYLSHYHWCEEECQDGYYEQGVDDLGRVCKICPPTCNKCEAEDHCTECKFSTFLTHYQACETTCPPGYYPNRTRDVGGVCETCPDECTQCSTASTCSECRNGLYLTPNGWCEEACPEGHYALDGTGGVGGTCPMCPENCHACNSAEECTVCRGFTHLTEYNQCRSECPNGYYENGTDSIGGGCNRCPSPCNLCETANVCTECAEASYLTPTGACEYKCPDRYHFEGSEDIGRFCKACPPTCFNCLSQEQCTLCQNFTFLTPDEKCEYTCPDGTYRDGIKEIGNTCPFCPKDVKRCISDTYATECSNKKYLTPSATCDEGCPDGYYRHGDGEVGRTCPMCAQNCTVCTNATTCQGCKNGQYLTHTHWCDHECPDGYYKSGTGDQGRICKVCHSSCNTCLGPEVCTECKQGTYLAPDGSCKLDCPEGYYKLPGTEGVGGTCPICPLNCAECAAESQCTICANSTYLHDKQCKPRCPDGWYHMGEDAWNRECMPCTKGCSQCTEKGFCTECKDGLFLNPDATCASTCPDGFFQLPGEGGVGGVCQHCSENCTKCSWWDQCQECKSSRYLTHYHWCAEECPSGYYEEGTGEVGRLCMQCPETCNLCEGPAHCTECKNSTYLTALHQCKGECPLGFFHEGIRDVGRTCQACERNCHQCVSSTECLECKNSTFLTAEQDCAETCPPGYYGQGEQILGNTCQKCSKDCALCDALENCIECTNSTYLTSDKYCVEECTKGPQEGPITRTLVIVGTLTCHEPRMLRIHSVSGEVLVTIELQSFLDTLTAESSPVRALWQHLHSFCGQPRFRQRLLVLGDDILLSDTDDEHILKPGELVLVNFISTSALQVEELQNDPDLGDPAPLLIASQRGHLEVARLLLEAKADKDKTLNDGATPLYISVQHGHLEVARILLDAKADMDKGKNNGATPLFIADKEKAMKNGATPLSIAAEKGHLEVARFLLDAKANMDNSKKAGLLLIAAEEGHLEVARLLLDSKATMGKCENHGARPLSTPLSLAAEKGHLDVARLLLDAKAKMEKATITGATPLSVAAEKGHSEVARLLLDAKANMDKAKNHGTTPLSVAAERGHLEADKEKAKNDGATPLVIAAHQGHLEVARLLLDAKADKEKTMSGGATPLSIAAETGHFEVARLLLDAKADDKEKAMNGGATPLSIAAEKGHLEANMDKAENDGATPLSIAAHQGQLEALQRDGRALQYASDNLKKDSFVVMEALKHDPEAAELHGARDSSLEFADEELKHNLEVIMPVAGPSVAMGQFCDFFLTSSGTVVPMSRWMLSRPLALRYLEAVFGERDFMLVRILRIFTGSIRKYHACAQPPRITGPGSLLVSPILLLHVRADREVVMAAVRKDGMALAYASQELQDDESIVEAATEENPRALQFASDRWRRDKELLQRILGIDGLALEFVTGGLANDFEVCMEAASVTLY